MLVDSPDYDASKVYSFSDKSQFEKVVSFVNSLIPIRIGRSWKIDLEKQTVTYFSYDTFCDGMDFVLGHFFNATTVKPYKSSSVDS